MTRCIALLFLSLFAITACGRKSEQANAPTQTTGLPGNTRQESPRPRMAEAEQIAALIDPAKLATLKERGANPRIQKITAILWTAKQSGKNPEQIANQAVAKIGWGGTPAGDLTAAAILRNLGIAEKLESTTPADIAAMRRGNAAMVRCGPYIGDIVSVDHIIPRSLAPQLDNVICNLELMPLRLNQRKGNEIGDRQRSLAKKLHAAGLLENPELPER